MASRFRDLYVGTRGSPRYIPWYVTLLTHLPYVTGYTMCTQTSKIIPCQYSKKILLCVRLYTLRTVPIKKDLAKKTVFSYTSLSSSCSDHRPVVRQLGPPRSALSGARASPSPAGRAAGRNNRHRPPLLPLPLPSPPRGRSRCLRAPPPPLPPPYRRPVVVIVLYAASSPSYRCRRIGRARGGAVAVVVLLLL
jgi:hypothetical protein